jgi:hypothetical protein
VTPSLALLLASLAAAPTRLAAPEWSTVNLSPELASFYAGEVARVLRGQGFEVITARDIVTVLGMERQKQLLGCSEASSCMAELGAALGCEAIITANLARLDNTFQGSLRVLSSRDGKTLADARVEATGERAMVAALETAAIALSQQLRPPPPVSPRSRAWIPLVAGVALGGGAAASLVVAQSNYQKIPLSDEGTAVKLANDGKVLQTSGWAMAGVGAAALVTAGLLLVLGGEPPTLTPQVSVTTSGATLGVSGAFP